MPGGGDGTPPSVPPGRYDGLPGLPFPGSPSYYPTKDELADYLEMYAHQFDLPPNRRQSRKAFPGRGSIRGGLWPRHPACRQRDRGHRRLHQPPHPPFAPELDESILQLHSKDYRNPSQLHEGGVLVVRAGNSGAEIAIEVARHHQTWLSGQGHQSEAHPCR